MDYKQRHIETEKWFYQNMNRRKTVLLTAVIVGAGLFFLYIQYWAIGPQSPVELWVWTLIVSVLFIALTLIGSSVFEHERKKYTKQ
ncbi:MAG: hypothetical protein JW771_02495 [Candidatus Thermoplasmatota archaeon]|nr:hypothetical protein [Candidatus Thermoplasmatota archaeon]